MLSDFIERISDFFYNLRIKFFSKNAKKVNAEDTIENGENNNNKNIQNEGGRIYALWRLALPVLFGLTLGYFASVCLSFWLDSSGLIRPAKQEFSENAARNEAVKNVGLDDFLAANPFKISPQKKSESEFNLDGNQDNKQEIVGSLATAIVRGTLPNVGVWLEDEGNSNFVLIGSSFDVYTLTRVSYLEAEFTRIREEDKSTDRVILELYFGPSAVKRPAAPAKRNAQSRAANANVPAGEVVSATEEQEGAIPSGLVNQLVQNPFDELKKVRLRPQGDAGLQIQWIQNDSILKKLGVQRGDIIKSINGIPFNNMADIANSINSLMNSERFDVEVDRKGKPTPLRYVVR